MSLRRNLLVIPLLAALVVAADAATKQWALEHLQKGVLEPVAAPLIGLTLVTNTGTAFGLWQSQRLIAEILPPVICAWLIAWIVKRELRLHQPLGSLELAGFGLVLGGAFGNMIDRLVHAEVTDYLYFVFWPAFPVFNLADALIDAGIVLIFLHVFLFEGGKKMSKQTHE